MEKAELGKKQYWVLLAISVAISFVLPLVFGLGSFYVFLGAFSYITLIAADIFSGINLAVLLYVSMRCRFSPCLPFAAGAILEYLTMSVVLLTVVNPVQITGITVAHLLYEMLFTYAPLFIYIGLIKVFSKKIRNEPVAIGLTLLCVLIVSFLSWKAFRTSERIIFINDGGGNITPQSITLDDLYKALYELRLCVISGVAYLILKLLFEKSARTGLLSGFKRIGSTAKKLWCATAK